MGNLQYIPVSEITNYALHVLRLKQPMVAIFTKAVCKIDDGVLHDHYSRVAAQREKEKAASKRNRKR